jgi:hypothetical protein
LQLYLLLFFFFFFFHHWSLWQPYEPLAGKLILFDILIEDSPNIKYTNFGVSNSFPLAPPTVQSFTHVYADNFWTVRARIKILFSSDSWAHDDSIAPYDVIFRHNSFPAILNFPKNLLFRTPPRPLLRISRKLNQINSRPWRQKVMEFKLIRITVLEYRANKFYVALAKTDVRPYLHNALSDSDQIWYMSSQAWPEATCCVSAQRHLLVRRYEEFIFLLITSERFVQKSQKWSR